MGRMTVSTTVRIHVYYLIVVHMQNVTEACYHNSLIFLKAIIIFETVETSGHSIDDEFLGFLNKKEKVGLACHSSITKYSLMNIL